MPPSDDYYEREVEGMEMTAEEKRRVIDRLKRSYTTGDHESPSLALYIVQIEMECEALRARAASTPATAKEGE